MLFYRGNVPEDMQLDASIDGLGAKAVFPFKYGYATVGEIVEVGKEVDASWVGRRVSRTVRAVFPGGRPAG